jgi:hypothetical protein
MVTRVVIAKIKRKNFSFRLSLVFVVVFMSLCFSLFKCNQFHYNGKQKPGLFSCFL